jgi:hypothetical protein
MFMEPGQKSVESADEKNQHNRSAEEFALSHLFDSLAVGHTNLATAKIDESARHAGLSLERHRLAET